MYTIIAIVLSYLLGSISFSFLAGKLLKGIDIRQHGSGNAGATNTLRVLGKKPAITVLLLDVAKGVAAIAIGRAAGGADWVPIVCGMAAIAGHNWPIYFGFRGGKGIATTIGVVFSIAPLASLVAGLIALAAVIATRYVSLGSLLFTGLLPIAIAIFDGITYSFWASLLVCIFAFVRHRTNIVKLWKGTENKLGGNRSGTDPKTKEG